MYSVRSKYWNIMSMDIYQNIIISENIKCHLVAFALLIKQMLFDFGLAEAKKSKPLENLSIR